MGKDVWHPERASFFGTLKDLVGKTIKNQARYEVFQKRKKFSKKLKFIYDKAFKFGEYNRLGMLEQQKMMLLEELSEICDKFQKIRKNEKINFFEFLDLNLDLYCLKNTDSSYHVESVINRAEIATKYLKKELKKSQKKSKIFKIQKFDKMTQVYLTLLFISYLYPELYFINKRPSNTNNTNKNQFFLIMDYF